MEPHKQYSQRVKESFHLTMASLDVSKADDHPTKVMMIFGGNATRYLLCTLDKKNVLQAPLNLLIEKGSFITFLCNGAGYVHLTGYLKNNALEDPNVGNIISAHIKEGITTEQLMKYLKRDKTIKYKEGTYGAWIIKQIDTKENQENEKEANSKRKTNAPEGEAANSSENESNNDICDDCLLDSFIIDDDDDDNDNDNDDDNDDDDYDNTLTSCYDSDVEIKMQENEKKKSQKQEKNGKQQEKGVTGEEANGKQKDKKKKKEEQRKNNTWLLPVFASAKPWLWKNRGKGQLCHSLLSCSCPAWVTSNAKVRSMLRRKWPQVQTCFRVCAPRCGRRNSWNESWRKASSHNTTENGIWLCSL